MYRYRNNGAPIPTEAGFIERGEEFEAPENAAVVRMWAYKIEKLGTAHTGASVDNEPSEDGSE